MGRWQKFCFKKVGKNVLTAAFGQIPVQPLHFGHTSTKHNNVGIQKVDDAGQGPAQADFITLQGRFARSIARTSATLYFCGTQQFAGMALMIRGQCRS